MKKIFFIILFSTLCMAGFSQELGLNFNHNPENINFDYVKKTGVSWIRMTPRILDYVDDNMSPIQDSAIQNVVKAGKEGYKIAFGFRWDFARRKLAMPAPGSEREQQYYQMVDRILERVGPYVRIFLLGNEPNLETIKSDLQYDAKGNVPLVVFTQRLLQHVSAFYATHAGWKKPQYYAGSLPALFEKEQQELPGVKEMIRFAQNDPRVTGLAVHLHIGDTLEIKSALEYVRTIMPHKPIIVPEFSLFRLYNRHFKDEIGESKEGAAFLEKHHLDPHLKVSEWLTKVHQGEIPYGQWEEMFKSQNWYIPHYLLIYQRYFKQYGVVLATYPLLQQGFVRQVNDKSESWLLNPLYLQKSFPGGRGEEYKKNPLCYQDFMTWLRNVN